MTTVHPFERAKLGVAPFRCIGMRQNWYSAAPGHKQPGGSCDYCGTGIAYEFVITSSDDKKFVVGCDCFAKTGAVVEGFKRIKSDADKAVRDERNAARRKIAREAREAANAERQRTWAIERETKYTAFLVAEPTVAAYLLNRTDGFLGEMNASLQKWGNLTDGQLAAVKRIMSSEVEKAASVHVGEIGKPLTGTFEVLATREHVFEGFPPRVSYWHLLRDEKGNVVTFRGVHLAEKGAKVSATFTVKAHETYKGTNQTVVQRPRKVVTLENGK